MGKQVRLVITNATVTQNAIKNIEVRDVSVDDQYRVTVFEPRQASASYLATDGDTKTVIANDLATDLNGADGVTASNTDENISLEVEGGKPIVVNATRWMYVTDVQEASQARDVELEYMRGKVVPAGGSITVNTDLEAIEKNGSLESLRADESRGLLTVAVLSLDEGTLDGDASFDSAVTLDDLVASGNLTMSGGEDQEVINSVVEGNVDLTGGGTLKASDVVIRGNLTVDATSSVDFAKVEVLGDVSFASGAGTVAWKGGSFHGTATDPDSKLGAAASGSYLSV